jgi:CBS domain-containing protein
MSGSEAELVSCVSCTVNDSLQHAAGIMSENDCSTIPVVNARGGIVGVITARDICMAAYRRGLPLWHMDVGSAMSSHAAASTAKQDVERPWLHSV